MNELCTKGAAELARLIRSRQITSTEVVEAYLARIEEVNSMVNAVTVVLADEARAAATAPSTGRSPPARHSDLSRVFRSRSRRTLTSQAQPRHGASRLLGTKSLRQTLPWLPGHPRCAEPRHFDQRWGV